MTPILFWGLKIALFLLAVAMLCALYRLLVGPAAQDRVMALDCLYMNGMLTMLVLGIVYASNVYFEAAMLIALFGFVGSTALAKFLLRGEVIEGGLQPLERPRFVGDVGGVIVDEIAGQAVDVGDAHHAAFHLEAALDQLAGAGADHVAR